jgi:hypothetical protein
LATYRAIAATGLAICGYLRNSCPRADFPKAEFELYQSNNFDKPMQEGISLYLYRVMINTSLRNLPPSTGPDGERYRPPLPLDLHYMLTAWAQTAEMQQRLLGWTMRELENLSILPAGLLNHYGPEADAFRPNETVELICDAISVQDMNNLWEAFKLNKVNQQLSIAYLVRMLLLESDIKLSEGAPVQTRVFEYGKAQAQ